MPTATRRRPSTPTRSNRWTILPRAGSRLAHGRLPDGVITVARPVTRTCIGCRQRASSTDLLRVVVKPVAQPEQANSGSPTLVLLPDPRRRAPGRGAWLHPAVECVDLAERRRAFGRALRVGVPLDPVAVRQYVESLVD